jgi:hypothetical protein
MVLRLVRRIILRCTPHDSHFVTNLNKRESRQKHLDPVYARRSCITAYIFTIAGSGGGRDSLVSPGFILPRACIGCSGCVCSHGISDTSYSYNVESTS